MPANPAAIPGIDGPPPALPALLHSYRSNHDFIHATGCHVPYGWSARYRIDPPGYLIQGQINGGEPLPAGIYRYSFYFLLQPGRVGGLLHEADDVVRVEAWDVTARECLTSRTFQIADFSHRPTFYAVKTLTFSTWKRGGHHFEPRIYWPGLSGVFVRRIDLERLDSIDIKELAEKSMLFEKEMGQLYLDRGFVVVRSLNGGEEDLGDSALWTGLYAATEAWRYKATHSPEALFRMENSLWALHQLCLRAPEPGTLVRYIYPDGHFYPDAPSKDSYSGFFFAIANALPVVRDPALRQALLEDTQQMADHFLDHDLAFVPAKGDAVDLNPFPSAIVLNQILSELEHHAGERHHLIRLLQAADFYFLLHAQKPWPELRPMLHALRRDDPAKIQRHLLPLLNGAVRALRDLERDVHHSLGPSQTLSNSPYGRLDHLLVAILKQLDPGTRGPAFQRLDDIKFLSSQSLLALHFLKVSAEALPKPNRFDAYYQSNLWKNKELFKTALEWNNMDEDLVAAVGGRVRAHAMGTAGSHLTFFALYDLDTLEKDSVLRKDYQELFERQYEPVEADYNAMAQVMQSAIGLSPDQRGMALWSLTRYPLDRRGKGERYWRDHNRQLARLYGGQVMGQARDPLPLDLRPKDVFIWQRGAGSLRGDDDHWTYPPLDYLFVYWMARANGLI